MSYAPEAVARAFGPFLAVEEYETIVSLNRKTRPPVFLRRNLSYSASRTDRRQRRANATASVRVQLESVGMPPQYSTAITLVVVLCAVVIGPDGREALVPLAARLGRVPVSQPGQPAPPPCVLTLPVPLPGGALPRDTVLLVLHKRDRSLSRLVRCMLRARHRGNAWLDGGKALTCSVADDRALQWFSSGTRILYGRVTPSEEMAVPAAERGRGAAPPTKQGLLELQPGVVDVNEPFFLDTDDSGSDESEESDEEAPLSEVPGSFSVRTAPVRDATPMLRYRMTLDAPEYGNDAEGEEIRAAKRRRRSSFTLASRSPSNDVLAAVAEGAATPAAPLTVHLCAAEGNLRSTIRLTQGFVCPFESCGQRCRPGVAPLLQHLTACHPYYEFYTTATPGEGPQVWVRVKKYWFDTDGSFLPSITSLTIPLANHPLAPLLWRAPAWLPFEYRCSRTGRRLRLAPGGKGPVDAREEEMEATAAAALEGKATAWETAELLTPGAVLTPDEDMEAEPRRENRRRGGQHGQRGRGGQRGGPRTRGSRRRLANASHALQSPSSVKLSLTTRSGLPKFYHSRGCVPMTTMELEDAADSDDDSDTELYMLHCRTALEEREGLCPEERDFMLAWNRYTHKNPVLADFEVPGACVAFAQAHAEAMADAEGPFRRCFAAHVVNLWKFRLLTPLQMHAALTAVPPRQAGAAPSS